MSINEKSSRNEKNVMITYLLSRSCSKELQAMPVHMHTGVCMSLGPDPN